MATHGRSTGAHDCGIGRPCQPAQTATPLHHLTPGQAYPATDNGNRSAVHWDLVCIQRPEYGGGEIRFDGKLIRKDGKFVLPELKPLNY